MTDNMILKNLDSSEDMLDNPMYDEEEDDAEALQELEKRKEELIEEFLELAYSKKHEAVEEVKAECKREKVPRDVEKKRVQEAGARMDGKRKGGMNEVRKKLNEIIEGEGQGGVEEKMGRLGDTEQIRAFMMKLFEEEKEGEEEQV